MPGKFILHGRLQQPEGSEAIVSGWWTQGKHPIVHHQNPEKTCDLDSKSHHALFQDFMKLEEADRENINIFHILKA